MESIESTKVLTRSPVLVLAGLNGLREVPWLVETRSSTWVTVQHTQIRRRLVPTESQWVSPATDPRRTRSRLRGDDAQVNYGTSFTCKHSNIIQTEAIELALVLLFI